MALSSAQRSNTMATFQRPSIRCVFARWCRLCGGSLLANGYPVTAWLSTNKHEERVSLLDVGRAIDKRGERDPFDTPVAFDSLNFGPGLQADIRRLPDLIHEVLRHRLAQLTAADHDLYLLRMT